MNENYHNDSIIIDNRKRKYGKKTISKYKLENVLNELNKSLKIKDSYKVIYFITELHASGHFDKINDILIKFIIFNFSLNFPYLPYIFSKYLNEYTELKNYLKIKNKPIIELRNNNNMRRNIWIICQFIKYISIKKLNDLISDTFFHNTIQHEEFNLNEEDILVNSNNMIVNTLFKNEIGNSLKYYLKYLNINLDNILYNDEEIDINHYKNKIFYILGKIINYNNRNNYTSVDNIDTETIYTITWTVILNVSKKIKNLFEEISSLYKIYKFIIKNNKNFNLTYLKHIIINAILYIIYYDSIDWDKNLLNHIKDNKNYIKINKFYQNIQQSIKNKRIRYDHIILDYKKKKKKTIFNTTKNIGTIKKKNNKYVLLNDNIESIFNIIPEKETTIDNSIQTNIIKNDNKIKTVNISKNKYTRKKKILK